MDAKKEGSNVSEYEQKLLSLSFVGIGEEGRYVFRFRDDPLRTIVGDFSDFCDWRDVTRRFA